MIVFRYCMIVTAEDERYGKEKDLGYWVEHPEDGLLQDIVFGQNIDTLIKPENEGLFYQLYDMETGQRVGRGSIDWGIIEEEIDRYEIKLTEV